MAKSRVRTIRGKNPVVWKLSFESVKGDADPILLAPDDVTGDARVVRLKDKIEMLGDVVGAGNFDRRSATG